MKLKEGSVKHIHSSLKELALELEKFAVRKRYEGEKEWRRWESTKVDRYMEINVLHITHSECKGKQTGRTKGTERGKICVHCKSTPLGIAKECRQKQRERKTDMKKEGYTLKMTKS